MFRQRLLGLALRIRTRVKRRRLDEQLARGADPAKTAALSLRAAQLADPATRRALASGLERTFEHAFRHQGITLRLRLHRAEIRACADDFLALAARLREDAPVDARGLAQAALLLTRGASPLDPDSGASIRQAVRSARLALESPPPSDGDALAA